MHYSHCCHHFFRDFLYSILQKTSNQNKTNHFKPIASLRVTFSPLKSYFPPFVVKSGDYIYIVKRMIGFDYRYTQQRIFIKCFKHNTIQHNTFPKNKKMILLLEVIVMAIVDHSMIELLILFSLNKQTDYFSFFFFRILVETIIYSSEM
jgi:hypothetical protein